MNIPSKPMPGMTSVCRKPVGLMFAMSIIMSLLCLVSTRADWYECYPNDWFEKDIDGAPATHALDNPKWPIYQSTTWFNLIRVWLSSQTLANSMTLKVGNLEISGNNQWEISIECSQVHKTETGEWWAEQVDIYRGYEHTSLENVNLGMTPLILETAATGGSELSLNAEIIEPMPQYKPPIASLEINGESTTGGTPKNVQSPGGATLNINMSATDANGNYQRTWLWAKTGQNGVWNKIYESTNASGSCTYTLAPAAGQTYFKCRAQDDTYAESPSAIICVEATAAVAPPVLAFDTASTDIYNDQTVTGSGWAADQIQGAPVNRVEVWIDGSHRGNATLGGDRPDVQNAYGRADWRYSGFNFTIPASGLSLGQHSVEVRAYNNIGLSATASRTFNVIQRIQGPVTSASASITVFSSWTPTCSGGNGTGAFQFYVEGQTGWQSVPWTPPAPDQYRFHVKKLGDGTYPDSDVSISYTLWVHQAEQPPVYSEDKTVYIGESFMPDFVGGAGVGQWSYRFEYIDGQGDTPDALRYNFDDCTDYTDPVEPGVPGTFLFRVHKDGDENYRDSTSELYILTILSNTQQQSDDVTSQNTTIKIGDAFNPQIQGGSGTGQYQFSVQGRTGWQSTPWTSSAAGAYQFNVKRLGDGTYQERIGSATYTLTVTEINEPPLVAFDHVSPAIYTDQSVIGHGWAADKQEGAPVNRVEVWIDGVYQGNASLNEDRPDVAAGMGRPTWLKSGFSFSIPSSKFPSGQHSIQLKAFDSAGMSATSEIKKFCIASRPAATISAYPSILQVGQSITIHISCSVDSINGDTLNLTAIKIVNGDSTESMVNNEGEPASQTLIFTPTHAGTYTFKACAQTGVVPDWNAYAACTVTVFDVNTPGTAPKLEVYLARSDWSYSPIPNKARVGETFYIDATGIFDIAQAGPIDPNDPAIWRNYYFNLYKNGNLVYSENRYERSGDFYYVDEHTGDKAGIVRYQASLHDDAGNFRSASLDVEIVDENWPIAEVFVDGLENFGRIARLSGEATTVTVRFVANAADNNLTGIRYTVGTPQRTVRETGFVAQSGGHGEVVLNIPLDEWGSWSFWMIAYDGNGTEVASQPFFVVAAEPPRILSYSAPAVVKRNKMCTVSGFTKEAMSPPPFIDSTERVNRVDVFVDDHLVASSYPRYAFDLPPTVAKFKYDFYIPWAAGQYTLHIRAFDMYGVMGSLSMPFIIVDNEPVALPPKGPERVYVDTPVKYVFSATDLKGDLQTQETYAAEPGTPFGVDDNWWPNRQDFVISGSTANTERMFSFNAVGRWELHHRVSDSTGFYDWNASENWSPISPVEVVNPSRNVSLEWWGQHSQGNLTFEQRIGNGSGDKIFLPGNTITLHGFCLDTDGISDVEWIRIQVIDPSGRIYRDWTSENGDDLNINSDGYGFMDRSFTFPVGSMGLSDYTIRVTSKMSGGETTQSCKFTLLNDGTTKDTDGDGIPDFWETEHGLNPSNALDAGMDFSGDGLTNLEKYIHDLDPYVYNTATSALNNTIPSGWPALVGTDSAKNALVGSTKGELLVDKNGAATYSIPFYVVPGTAGMQPSISLDYSSQSSSNIAGYGWSLSGFSTITRGPKTKVVDNEVHGVDFSYNDQYYLDGQRLILVSGTHGFPDAEYRTETDRFSRIITVGSAGAGPKSFKVWTKAGWCLEFGGTSDSELTANGSGHTMEVQTWAVSSVTDAYGNYMTYTYNKDKLAGEQYLARISYTGKKGNSTIQSQPFASLRFAYDDRPDPRYSYIHGSKFSVTKRLLSVSAWHGEAKVRSYSFSYIDRQPSMRSLLASITESTPSGDLPSTTLRYTNPQDGWDRDDRWAPPNKIEQFGNTTIPWPIP